MPGNYKMKEKVKFPSNKYQQIIANLFDFFRLEMKSCVKYNTNIN